MSEIQIEDPFHIGEPVSEVPGGAQWRHAGKYTAIYEAADRLENGGWLPVTFQTKAAARGFAACVNVNARRKGRFTASYRKNVVYIRRRVAS